ncbi:MAG: CpsD/CapB family tyrosine-protein kinase [Lachnospiraceae bacterium]|nr:CpsD/CapB family tyrosine-protein kinase [Lachnospiraceae bacterium]
MMVEVELKKLNENNYYYAEAIKKLRTNVQFSGKDVKVIAFTSSLPGEGKSDVTYALAQSFSQIGKRVVIVDADIRKSVLASRLEVNKKIEGLSDYLSGQSEFDNVLYKTNYPNLDIVFAGSFSPNPAELLEEELFGEMLEHLKNTHDYVFVDTPPVRLVTDSSIVAKYCDGIILVVEAGAISYRVLQKVRDQLADTGTKILGTVLNKVDMESDGYYGKYGKYGKYGEYK